MADYAEGLARSYKERGEQSGEWKEFLKAHGLANYCVAVDSTPERCRLVYDVEVSWYKGNHPISYEEHQKLTNKHKRLLSEYRDEVKANYGPVDALAMLLDTDDIHSERNINNARNFCDELFEISRKVCDGFLCMARSIMEGSVEMLKSANINAPCGFVVIGLGSIAKGEVTLYSDLEYAFITERDDTSYFEMLAMESYFRIGNLGETPLKCFDIEELKVQKGSPPVVADLKTVGFRINGITNSSGNIPTGNGLEGGQSPTLTVDNFIQLCSTSADTAGDKSDMLSSTVVIYTNEGEESQLYNRLIEKRKVQELAVAQDSVTLKEKRLQSFLKDINTFTFMPTVLKCHPLDKDIKAKSGAFRYPTLLANNIRMSMGWNSRYPWEIYSELYNREMISEEVYSCMRFVLALCMYMTTRACLQHTSHADHVSLVPRLTRSEKELYLIPSSLFVMLGCFIVPLNSSVKSNVENASFAADGTSLADAMRTAMQRIKVDNKNVMDKVEICYFAGEYGLARKELNEVMEAAIETITPSQFLTNIARLQEQCPATKYTELCSYILYHNQFYRVAADYFSWLIDNGQSDIYFWKLLSAHCRKEIGDSEGKTQLIVEVKHDLEHADLEHAADISSSYRDIGDVYRLIGQTNEAIEYYKLALEKDIAMFGETAHPNIAADYNGIGFVYIISGEFSSALEFLTKSLEMKKAIYGADANHPNIADSCYNIASLYGACGNNALALQYHIGSLKMRKIVYGGDSNNPAVADSYNSIANIYVDLGEYSSSLECCQKSLEMRRSIYGADTNHPDIAGSYNNIASVYEIVGDYDLSLEYHIQSLEMKKAMYGADTNHPEIAASYNYIANVYTTRSDSALSLEYHLKSLAMTKAIYGAEANHSDIAESYNNIAEVYNDLGDFTSSLEFYVKSLEMRKAIHGADTNHPDIADSYNHIANVYHRRSDFKLSLEYHKKSLEMKKDIYGEVANTLEIAGSYNNIAIIHSNCGDNALSLEYHMKSLDMKKAIYGADSNHPDIANSYNNIANSYNANDDLILSLEYHIKSLKMKKAIYGADSNHPDIANSYNNIANTYDHIGDHTSSLEYHMKSLEAKKAIYGADSNNPNIARSYNNIAMVQEDLGDFALSLQYYNRSMDMGKALYGAESNHPEIANGYNNIANIYNVFGSNALALEYHNKSLEMKKVIFGANSNHPEIANSYNNIATVYDDCKDYTLSLEYYKKSLEMFKAIYGANSDHPDIVMSKENIAEIHQKLES